MSDFQFPVIEGFTILSLINEGSFAKVYKGRDRKGNTVAIKCINKLLLSPRQQREISREANILKKLSHGLLVVRILTSIETDEYLYLVQELCDSDLFDLIVNGTTAEKGRSLFRQLCRSVAFCHENSVFHRDLKPENILLKNGELKLADFGLSTTSNLSDEFQIGSCRYMSPEVFCQVGKQPYFCSSNDVWSLGIILINLLTGHNPWNEPTLENKRFNCYVSEPKKYMQKQFKFSDEFCAVLGKVFAIDPLDRPTAAELCGLVAEIPFFMPGHAYYQTSKRELENTAHDSSSYPTVRRHEHQFASGKGIHLCGCSNKLSHTPTCVPRSASEGYAENLAAIDQPTNFTHHFNRRDSATVI